jgi:hypothetical protein
MQSDRNKHFNQLIILATQLVPATPSQLLGNVLRALAFPVFHNDTSADPCDIPL